MAELAHLLQTEAQRVARAGGALQRVRRLCGACNNPPSGQRFPLFPRRAGCDAEGEECLFYRTTPVLDEREHKVLHAHGRMPALTGVQRGHGQHSPRVVGV